VKHGQESKERHQAVFMTPEFAAQVASFYPGKHPEIHEEIRHTDDSTVPLPTELSEVGESISVSELESNVRAALRTISKADVQLVVDRVLAEA
jgi:NAD(P)H-dependent FMN reductase